MDISIIIVNWNVKELLRNCLHALLEAGAGLALEIIVVDSASTDGSVQMVRQEFPQVRLVASAENLGYSRGNNTGCRVAGGRYLFLLNPDTVVQPDTLQQLVRYMEAHPAVGAAGPQLLWPDGSLQSSRRRLPTLGTLFWESTLLGQWFPHNRHIHYYHMLDQPLQEAQPVEWVVGAALFIRRETWEQVGPLDETFFMYFEETDWLRRCAEAGWEIVYLPEARLIHYEGKSSEQGLADRAIRFQRSKLHYTRKYFGGGWSSLLRVFLWLTFAFQWAEETAKWLIGHRRPLRRQRMGAYRQVLQALWNSAS